MKEWSEIANGMPLPEPADKLTIKHHQVDEHGATLLAEGFGIQTDVILDALEGEPTKQALAFCEWAVRTEDLAHALRCWTRWHGRGAYRAPSVARDGIQEQQDGTGRGSGPARSGGIAPAFVRANLERMEG